MNSKEEQTNSEVTNLENESLIKEQKDANYIDENNVEKFCNILLELKNNTKTKFLIITHHKITMTSIDRVYGVTMAQKGISDIVSVDFEKINLKEAV